MRSLSPVLLMFFVFFNCTKETVENELKVDTDTTVSNPSNGI